MSITSEIVEYTRLIMEDALLEENNEALRHWICEEVTEFIHVVTQQNHGLDAYNIICDESNNSPVVINNGEIRVTLVVVENGKRQEFKLRAP